MFWSVLLMFFMPYINQYQVEWWAPFDCGPASSSMVIEFYTGETTHPLQFYNEMGTDMLKQQNLVDLSNWMSLHNVPSKYKWDMTLEELQSLVTSGTPVIVLVEYPEYGHIMVVTGMDNKYIYFNDPKTIPNRRMLVSDFAVQWDYQSKWLTNMAIVPKEGINETAWSSFSRVLNGIRSSNDPSIRID